MNFVRWVQSHRRSLLFLLSALAIGGAFSAFTLPVSLFPRVSFPRVVVDLDAGDRPADRMAIEVTQPVEEAVRSLPGIRSVRSTTSRGSAELSINFEWGLDMVAAMLQVESAVNQTLPSLPAGTTFEVRRMNPTVMPVLGYSLVSDTHSLVELRDIALYQIRPLLTTVPGVARVEPQGGETEEYRVTVDPAKLAAYGMSLDDVSKALSAANVITAVGRLEEYNKLYLVLTDTQFHNLDEIRNTVLRSGENGLVHLSDVARLTVATVPQWTRVTADGHDAVLIQVYQQPGGNTVRIADDIKARLKEFRPHLPSGVRIANWYDQSELIVSSAKSVRDAVGFGILLAALVLFVFLRNPRVTLISAITVPMVLAATVLLLWVLNMSFNIMTLGGMAAAVALIIDDAIVMIEHIIRRLRDGEGHYHERVLAAAAEFTRPLAGSSASTIIIFTPLAFLTGVTGAFFKALSLTMAAALFISFVTAWIAVPLLSLHILRHKDTEQEEDGPIFRLARRTYHAFLTPLLRRPWLIFGILIPFLAIGWFAYQHTGSGFMPAMDEGGFILDYWGEPGTSLTEMNRLLKQVGKIIQETPEVSTYSRRTGLQLGGGVTEANEGDFFIRLKPPPRRDIDEIMDDVRQRVEHKVPGLRIEMAQLMEDMIGDLTAVPQPIEIKIFSDNEAVLEKTAHTVAASIGKVPGVVDVSDGIVYAGDALIVHVDREKAALEGVDPDDVSGWLEGALSGVVATQIQKSPKMIGVRVWTPQGDRSTAHELENLRMRAPDGHLFPLSRIVTLERVSGQPQITRDDLKRMIAVTGRISGRDMGSTLRDIMNVLNRPGALPPGVYYTLGGLYQQQQIAFRGMIAVISAAIALVFVLLLYLYESFRVAIAMLLTVLPALAAVFMGLYITHTELNITALMGMTMIVGIVTEVAIFFYSEYQDLGGEPGAWRLIQAGMNRMRPIAMTTLAAILALMPLALGIGQGAAMQQPLAIAIVSGLVVQFPLVLTVLPAFLVLFRRTRPTNSKSNGVP